MAGPGLGRPPSSGVGASVFTRALSHRACISIPILFGEVRNAARERRNAGERGKSDEAARPGYHPQPSICQRLYSLSNERETQDNPGHRLLRRSARAAVPSRCGATTAVRAASGEAALGLMEREEVDIAISDVSLAGVTGLELLQIVRQLSAGGNDPGSRRHGSRGRGSGDQAGRLPLSQQGHRSRLAPDRRRACVRAPGFESPRHHAPR